MARTAFRPRLPRPRSASMATPSPFLPSPALQIEEVLQIIRDLKALKQTFEAGYAGTLGKADKHLEKSERDARQLLARLNTQITTLEEFAAKLMERVMGELENFKGESLQKFNDAIEHAKQIQKGDKGDSPSISDIVETVLPLIPSPEIPKPEKINKDELFLFFMDQIAKKKLPIEYIKGLRDELRHLSSRIARGGGGGGTGIPQKFSFAGDGVTTSFTLPEVPSGNGLALWSYFNGQWLQPDTHFTVSGKTFTTTFTAAADTVIEGFLIP